MYLLIGGVYIYIYALCISKKKNISSKKGNLINKNNGSHFLPHIIIIISFGRERHRDVQDSAQNTTHYIYIILHSFPCCDVRTQGPILRQSSTRRYPIG